MRQEKFRRGDLVRISKDLGPSMEHFDGKGARAIVLGSYRDQYGGSGDHATKEYSLFIEDFGHESWFHEHQLTLIEKGSHALLETWEDQMEAWEERQSSVRWIVEHWKEVREKTSSTSILALFHAIGWHSAFERNGEYFCLWEDWYKAFGFFDQLITKSLEELRAMQKPDALPEHVAEVERCWHALHDLH